MTLFRQKYRIESTRLPGWDYSAAGYYFVTICTRHREPFFGEVVNDDVHLSPIGEIVAEEWLRTEQVRPNVRLDEWIIMPNHVHGIIMITHRVETSRRDVSIPGDAGIGEETGRRPVSTGGLQPNSLGSMIGQIKSLTTKRIWKAGYPYFGWQERFYDRIVRDQEALVKARAYIIGNPYKWPKDRENPAGVFM